MARGFFASFFCEVYRGFLLKRIYPHVKRNHWLSTLFWQKQKNWISTLSLSLSFLQVLWLSTLYKLYFNFSLVLMFGPSQKTVLPFVHQTNGCLRKAGQGWASHIASPLRLHKTLLVGCGVVGRLTGVRVQGQAATKAPHLREVWSAPKSPTPFRFCEIVISDRVSWEKKEREVTIFREFIVDGLGFPNASSWLFFFL